MQTVKDAGTISVRELRSGEDATAFRTLNEEWITRFFVLEEKDRETLGDPGGKILAKGGRIFLVEDLAGSGVQTVGCVALIPMEGRRPTLSKMAVSPSMRGRGIGRQLIHHVIEQARIMGARSLFLGSSTKLPNAVHLYEAVGFQHIPPERLAPSPYARADVFMELAL